MLFFFPQNSPIRPAVPASSFSTYNAILIKINTFLCIIS